MSQQINPRTGLRETLHPHFRVPHVRQRSFGALRLDGQPTAVHTAPIGHGLTLDWYSRLNKSGELIVTFHGANMVEKNIYPMFARISSLRDKAPAMMAFADPTIMVDKDRTMLLAWYLGGPDWDPLPLILKAVKKAQGKTGAEHVAFVGGSGGGFAALRASAMLPGSMAFVQDPQTILANYIPHVLEHYFATVWPGEDAGRLIEAFPERFNMVRLYEMQRPDNFVYYAQNDRDTPHIVKHYEPFEQLSATAGQRVFALYRGAVAGHGKINAAEFDHHYAEAMRHWRMFRDARFAAQE